MGGGRGFEDESAPLLPREDGGEREEPAKERRRICLAVFFLGFIALISAILACYFLFFKVRNQMLNFISMFSPSLWWGCGCSP